MGSYFLGILIGLLVSTTVLSLCSHSVVGHFHTDFLGIECFSYPSRFLTYMQKAENEDKYVGYDCFPKCHVFLHLIRKRVCLAIIRVCNYSDLSFITVHSSGGSQFV